MQNQQTIKSIITNTRIVTFALLTQLCLIFAFSPTFDHIIASKVIASETETQSNESETTTIIDAKTPAVSRRHHTHRVPQNIFCTVQKLEKNHSLVFRLVFGRQQAR